MQYSIRTNILTIFLLLIIAISASLLTTQYYFNTKLATDSTDKAFKYVTQNILDYVTKQNRRIENILSANYKNIHFNKPITMDFEHPALHDLTQLLLVNRGIRSIYFAQENNSFYKLTNIKSTLELKNFKIPTHTQWIVTINTQNNVKYFFLDQEQKLLKSIQENSTFSVKDRPWYRDAMSSTKPVKTAPYLFKSPETMGITYASRLHNIGSVLAIDFTVEQLNQILFLQKFSSSSEVFLFNDSGKIVASSKFHNTTQSNNQDSLINIALLNTQKTNQDSKIIKYTQDGSDKLSIYTQLYDNNLYLAFTLDAKLLLAPYNDNLKYMFLVSIVLLLLSAPIIFFATNLIVKPIKKLIYENKKIKNRDFKSVENIQTHIIEFNELSASLVNMSQSIYSYQKSQEELLDSIIKLIAEAVDAKSPYTGGHCERVPQIAQMLVAKASESNDSCFKDFILESEDDLREFEIGSWLHDCGKVTTPEYVVDKSTKLETINNRIHEIRTRFEVLWRDAQIDYLQKKLNGNDSKRALETLNSTQKNLLEDFEFIANANIGGEYMSPDKQERIRSIAKQEWIRHFDDSLGLGEVETLRYDKENAEPLPAMEKLLSDKNQHIVKRENFDYASYEKHGFKEEVPENLYNYGEVYNLCIAKGTLSPEERYKINEHVILTIKMLEKIPFPSQMTKIPEYAGTHHETLIGTGYPRKLSANELSIPARIMALADVFEALTASDRPYKKAKTLSESINILSFMVKDKHLDEDVFKLFLRSDLHNVYAKKYLKPEQIDKVDIKQYL